jgi:hypothetical protein
VSLLGERDSLQPLLNALSLATIAKPRIAAFKAYLIARNVRRHLATVTKPRIAAYKANPTARNVRRYLVYVAKP